MRNIDVYAETNKLTEKLVEEIGKDQAEEIKPEPEMTLKQLKEMLPRKLKRQVEPEKKFGNTLMAKLAKKRLEKSE